MMGSQKPVRRRGRPKSVRAERRSALVPIIARVPANIGTTNTQSVGTLILPNIDVAAAIESSNISDATLTQQSAASVESLQTGNQNHNRKKDRDRNCHNAEERQRKEKINRWISKLGSLLMTNPGERQSKCLILEKAYNYIIDNESRKSKVQCNIHERSPFSSVDWLKLYSKVGVLQQSLQTLINVLRCNSIEIPQDVVSSCKNYLPNFILSASSTNQKRICNFLNFFNQKKKAKISHNDNGIHSNRQVDFTKENFSLIKQTSVHKDVSNDIVSTKEAIICTKTLNTSSNRNILTPSLNVNESSAVINSNEMNISSIKLSKVNDTSLVTHISDVSSGVIGSCATTTNDVVIGASSYNATVRNNIQLVTTGKLNHINNDSSKLQVKPNETLSECKTAEKPTSNISISSKHNKDLSVLSVQPQLKQNFEIQHLIVSAKLTKDTSKNSTKNANLLPLVNQQKDKVVELETNRKATVIEDISKNFKKIPDIPSCQPLHIVSIANTTVALTNSIPVPNINTSSYCNTTDHTKAISKSNKAHGTQTVSVTRKVQMHSKVSTVKSIRKPYARNRKPSAPNKRWGSVVQNVLQNDMFMTSFIIGRKSTVKIKSTSISQNSTNELSNTNFSSQSFVKANQHEKHFENVTDLHQNKDKVTVSSNVNNTLKENSKSEFRGNTQSRARKQDTFPQENGSVFENVLHDNSKTMKNLFVSKTNSSSSTTSVKTSVTQKKSLTTNTMEVGKALPKKNINLPLVAADKNINKKSVKNKSTVETVLLRKNEMFSNCKPSTLSSNKISSVSNTKTSVCDNPLRNKWLEIENTMVSINTTSLPNVNSQCVSPVISFPKNLTSKVNTKTQKLTNDKPTAISKHTVAVSSGKKSSKSFTAEALCKPASNNVLQNSKKQNNNYSNQYAANGKSYNTKMKNQLSTKHAINQRQRLNKNAMQNDFNNFMSNTHIHNKLKHQPDINSLPNFLNIFNPNQIPGSGDQISGNTNQMPGSANHASSIPAGLSNFSAEALLGGTMNMLNSQYQEPNFPDNMILHGTNNLFTNFSADTLINDSPLPYGIDNLIAQNNTANCWNPPHTWLPSDMSFPEQLFPSSNVQFNHPHNTLVQHINTDQRLQNPPRYHSQNRHLQEQHVFQQQQQHFMPVTMSTTQNPVIMNRPNQQFSATQQNPVIINRPNNQISRPHRTSMDTSHKRAQQQFNDKQTNKPIECSPIKSITSILEPPPPNICNTNINNIPPEGSNSTTFDSFQQRKVTTENLHLNEVNNQFTGGGQQNYFHHLKLMTSSANSHQQVHDQNKAHVTRAMQQKGVKAGKAGPSFGNFSLVNST